VLDDLRQAFRSVGRHARFSAFVCAILALGIGATTLAFGIDAVAFVNYWIQHPERLGWIFSVDTHHGNDRAAPSLPDFLDFRERTHAFASLGARARTTLTLTGRGQASRLAAWQVTANLLDIWGLKVAIGRGFRDGEDLPAAPRVVVISNRLWQTTLAGDPSVIGSSITLDGVPHTVVGVFEPRLDLVFANFASTALCVPFDLAVARKAPRDARSLTVVGVLKPGVTVAQAHNEVYALARQLAAEHPDTNRGWDARVVDTHTGRTGPQTYYNLGLISIAGGLVLLNACVNVALLLLSRALARQKEFSVRLAVGAGRFRIVRQQAFEGLLIAITATVIGLALAVCAVKLLRMSGDAYYDRIPIDWQLFRVAAYTSLVTPLTFGLVPAVQLLRNRIPLTTAGWTEAQTGRTGRRMQRILATSQLGAALVLVIVSAIILQSVLTSMLINTGFNTRRVMTTNLALPAWKYADRNSFAQTFTRFIDRVSGIPGVTSAAASSVVPAITTGPAVAVRLESETPAGDGPESAELNFITPHLFETIGIDVVSGRDFTALDTADTPLVAVVNRQFALRYVANPHDLVRRRLSVRGESRLRDIVGVVGNTRNVTGGDVPAVVFLPSTQEPQRTMFLVARVPDGSSLEPVRRTLAEVDPDVAPYQLGTVKEAIRLQQLGDLAWFGLFGVLAAVSAALAALGLFGMFSCLVAERRRDFAIRLALGASPRDVSRLIFKCGFVTMVPGVIAGVLGGALLSRFAIGVVYGITADPYDPLVYAGSVLLLITTAVAALIVPARRASSVEVAEVLRT
jgi:putative ABC transport system permease protein